VRILGEHNRGKLYNPVPDKKDTYFLGIRKNTKPPPMLSGILKERVGNDVGRRVGND
jgi:hypothetical protein